MKATILGLFFIFSSSAFCQDVQLVTQDGKPRLGVQYVYDSAGVSFNIIATVVTQSLPAKRPLFVQIQNAQTKTPLSDWYQLNLGRGSSLSEVITLGLDRKSSLKTMKALPNVILVFASDTTSAQVILDLKSLCQISPGNFLDLTSGTPGCSPNRSRLQAIAEETGGACSLEAHKDYCGSAYDGIRDAISKQKKCVFKCN